MKMSISTSLWGGGQHPNASQNIQQSEITLIELKTGLNQSCSYFVSICFHIIHTEFKAAAQLIQIL